MALTDKNILITPNTGSSTDDPKILFTGADASTNSNITLKVYPTNSGTISFEGNAGQLFSITNSLSGTIFSVNDVSGIPSIEVLDTGLVKLAQYSGNVVLGSGTDNGLDKLQVTGSISATGNLTITGNAIKSNFPLVLNDISNQFDGLKAVFPLLLDQTSATSVYSIVDSKDLEVVVDGKRLLPYITEIRYPWITPYDSYSGFKYYNGNVIIYNAPSIGAQAMVSIINTSITKQTRRYPYSATTVALGD